MHEFAVCVCCFEVCEPRRSLKKVLIVAVRSCGYGVLVRGLQNLGASCKRNVFRTFRVYEKYQKYTRGLRTSGVLLVLFVQAKRINPFPFREARGSANLDSARRNGGFAQTKLKPSQREIRGFANLESAHPNNNFTRTKLNPFPKGDSRFCKPRISAPKTTISH